MKHFKEISEQISYTHTSAETLDEIAVTICDDEIEKGCPTVMLSNRGEKLDIALQDIPALLNLLNTATSRLILYTDRSYFEENKVWLSSILGETWVSIFQNYHEKDSL